MGGVGGLRGIIGVSAVEAAARHAAAVAVSVAGPHRQSSATQGSVAPAVLDRFQQFVVIQVLNNAVFSVQFAHVREASAHRTEGAAAPALRVVVAAAVAVALAALAAVLRRAFSLVAVVAPLVGHCFTVFAVHRAVLTAAGDTAARGRNRFTRRKQSHELFIGIRLHHQEDNQVANARSRSSDGVDNRPYIHILRAVS